MSKLRPFAAIFACLIFLNAFPSYGQQQVADSLNHLIRTKTKDPRILSWYYDIGRQYFLLGKQDSGLVYLKRGFAVSDSLKQKEWYSKLGLRTGGLYALMSVLDSANRYLELANPYKLKIDNDTLFVNYFNFKAAIAINQGDSEMGADYSLKTIEILEKMGDRRPPGAMIQNYVNLIICLKDQKQFDRAEEYLQKAIKSIDYAKDKQQLSLLYFNAAAVYIENKNYPKFKQFLDSADFYNRQITNYVLEVNIKAAYGEYYFQTKDYEKSYELYLESYQSLKEKNQTNFIPLVAMGVAQSLPNLGRWEEAIGYYEEAVQLAKANSTYRTLAEAYAQLKKLYADNRQFEKAYEYGLLHVQYNDSVSSTESKKNLQLLEAKYQNEKKEKEISELSLVNKQQELEVTKRNRWIGIGGIVSISILSILGLLYRNANQRQLLAEKDQKLQEEQIIFLERQQQVVSLQSMINGQESERTRIAKDLHDGLGGLFSTIKMHFSTLQYEQPQLKTEPLFSKSYEMVNTASEEVRRIAHNMMPEVLIKLGLVQAVQELCNSISAGKLLQASLQAYGMDQRLSPSTEVMLFRILQELLNNIIKHSGATQAIIQFNREGNRLSVTVEDNGRGFSRAESDGKAHSGLDSVESRVNYLNGKLSIDSQKEVGTTVMMDFLIEE